MWGILAESLSTHLPEHAKTLHLSFSLADAARLEQLVREAGFADARVSREVRRGAIPSFDEYWTPIEAGTGSLPQAYLALPEASRRAVREEVRERLTHFASEGRLEMSVEMLVASGQA